MMSLDQKISALELTLSVAAGGALACYRGVWAGDNGNEWALAGGAAAVVLIAAALFCERSRARFGDKARLAGHGGMTLLAASGFVLLLSAALFWMMGDGVFSVLTMLKSVFPGACGIAALVRLKQGDDDRLSALLCLFPVFYLCFFLLLFYRANADGPIVRLYGFEIAAVMAVLLGLYLLSAVRFDKAPAGLRAAAMSLGIAAAVMELALLCIDRTVLFAVPGFDWGVAAMLLGMGLQLIYGLFCPGRKLPAPEKTDSSEKDESEKDQSEKTDEPENDLSVDKESDK